MKEVDEASVQRTVEMVWRDVFAQELDGDDGGPAPLPGFFELGGSSLAALALSTLLTDELGVELSSADIMTFPLSSELAREIWNRLTTSG